LKNYTKIIKNLKALDIKASFEQIKSSKEKNIKVGTYKISKEISPYNLYLYLFSRFNKPNGLLSLVRNEDSDQLFHWHYSLHYEEVNIQIMCTTYRIEVVAPINLIASTEECIIFLKQLVKDLQSYKQKASKVRNNIENWEMLVNPFARIQKQINILTHEMESLKIQIPNFQHSHTSGEKLPIDEFSKWSKLTEELSAKSYSVRCLVPVYIETFINFIIQILAKQELKDNEELFEKYIREQIHLKIQSLDDKCIGFIAPIDWSDDICTKVHTIFNKRNDLLHGNFKIKDLKYGDVGFVEKMPLFKKLSSFKEDILNLELSTGKSDTTIQEIEDAQMFMMFVLIHLEQPIAHELKDMLESNTLGWNKKTKRFGILFNNDFVEYHI